MDYDDLEETLRIDYNKWCEDNGYRPNPDMLDRFTEDAITTIETMMAGGISVEEAYEQYKENDMYADMDYIREEYE